MKSICKYCCQGKLIKWGERRRYCEPCNRTFSVPKAGRGRSKKTGMYLLDRSTFRRIGFKTKTRDTTVLRGLHKEIASLQTPLDYLKKIVNSLQVFSSWTAST